MATKAIDAPTSKTGAKTNQRRIRKIFGNIHEISDMPNLIEVQRESYEQFLRSDPSIGYISGLECMHKCQNILDLRMSLKSDFQYYLHSPIQ